ncbi:ras association domain-containing protein 8b isoform X2 [Engraulis encrasicolus]|uniref:ras association domain-containing protein 8b isoform X2 n=1 Tax=Engraulis encrasicolus TaxID=184585 RepID=UPI002FD62256
MRAMELKVWVDGVQRIVCGVTEVTTCQEVVIALAQAIGRTGRYTLIEKWRETERHLAPHENPVASLNKWGQYASDVQLVLQRTGPSLSERPTSEGMPPGVGGGGVPPRVPERGLYRQSLPPLAKLRPAGLSDRSLKRREPKRKSLTFTGGSRGLRDIFGKGHHQQQHQQQQQQQGHHHHHHHPLHHRAATPIAHAYQPGSVTLTQARNGALTPIPIPMAAPSPTQELSRLVHLQQEKLRSLESCLQSCQAEMQAWMDTGNANHADHHRLKEEDEEVLVETEEEVAAAEEEERRAAMREDEEEQELLRLEQQLRRNEAEMQEEEFWENELQIERESERQLREQLLELRARVGECEARLSEYAARIQGMEAGLEAERLQQEMQETRQANEEELRVRLEKVRGELDLQAQHTARLDNSCRAVDRSLGQSSKRLQKEQELEQLTKELRQVNLQQFIQQTGTKVTVLPAEPTEEDTAGTDTGTEQTGTESADPNPPLKRLGSGRQLPNDLRALQSPHSSSFNPEGIYV